MKPETDCLELQALTGGLEDVLLKSGGQASATVVMNPSCPTKGERYYLEGRDPFEDSVLADIYERNIYVAGARAICLMSGLPIPFTTETLKELLPINAVTQTQGLEHVDKRSTLTAFNETS